MTEKSEKLVFEVQKEKRYKTETVVSEVRKKTVVQSQWEKSQSTISRLAISRKTNKQFVVQLKLWQTALKTPPNMITNFSKGSFSLYSAKH